MIIELKQPMEVEEERIDKKQNKGRIRKIILRELF